MVCAPLGLPFTWTSGFYHLPHTNFSSVCRTHFRDFQMFKMTTPPVDHVSLKRMSRNSPKRLVTSTARADGGRTLCACYVTAIPTVGIIHPERNGPEHPPDPRRRQKLHNCSGSQTNPFQFKLTRVVTDDPIALSSSQMAQCHLHSSKPFINPS